MGKRFRIVLDFDEEDGGFTVTVPALPEYATEGDTIEAYGANVLILRATKVDGFLGT